MQKVLAEQMLVMAEERSSLVDLYEPHSFMVCEEGERVFLASWNGERSYRMTLILGLSSVYNSVTLKHFSKPSCG